MPLKALIAKGFGFVQQSPVRDYPQNIIGKTRPGQNWQRERLGSAVKV
ncbi:MAG: hypothetical protein RIM23_26460 [Coleofasciculus sp. G3-WIS-01]